ncbi:hypothetical protein ACVW17_003438 [Bradyrhizobium sp. USDA 4473]
MKAQGAYDDANIFEENDLRAANAIAPRQSDTTCGRSTSKSAMT